jgi:hypothetical protein
MGCGRDACPEKFDAVKLITGAAEPELNENPGSGGDRMPFDFRKTSVGPLSGGETVLAGGKPPR